jgi:hypothetical protein
MPTSFIFREDWRNAISGLPDKVKLEVYEAIIEYGLYGTLPRLKSTAMLAFNFIKNDIDQDNHRADEIRRKRSQAGKRHKGNQYTKMEQMEQMEQVFQPKQDDTSGKPMDKGFTDAFENGTNVPSEKERIEKEKIPPKSPHSKEKEKEKKKSVDANHAAFLLERRKDDFYNSLIPFVQKFGREMVREFFDYWTEPNKSKTKMRFELERTWDVSRRLNTWSRNNQFSNRRNGSTQTHQRDFISDQQVVANTYNGIAALSEKERAGGNEQVPF